MKRRSYSKGREQITRYQAPPAPGTVPLHPGIEGALKGTFLESPKQNFIQHPGPDLSKYPEANKRPRSPLRGIPGIPASVHNELTPPTLSQAQNTMRQIGELPRRAINAGAAAMGSGLHALERPDTTRDIMRPRRDPTAAQTMGQKSHYAESCKRSRLLARLRVALHRSK
jgi:hypothetical protein